MAVDIQADSVVNIEGYADQLSLQPGEQIGFHISTDLVSYSVEIAREGAERVIVWTKDRVPGAKHAAPANAATHGCNWPQTLALRVPSDWKSGYYSVLLRGKDAHGNTAIGELFFVVRSAHPGRDAKILLQLTTNTGNAYNTWGGSSLYRGPNGPGRRVSFDRPYAGLPWVDGLFFFSLPLECQGELESGVVSERFQSLFQEHVDSTGVPGISLSPLGTITSDSSSSRWRIDDINGAGPPAYRVRKHTDGLHVYDGTPFWESGWRNWERPFVAWAEHEGYAIDYAVSTDLEFRPEILEHYCLVLSVGHDEYWSAPMRDHLEAYIADGGNVAFFSGNCVWRQVRSEDEGRTLVCWKDAYEQDPLYKGGDHRLLSTYWCHRLIGRPENHLTGVSFAYGGYSRFFDQFVDSPGGYTIHRPDHWMLEGTGLRQGDMLGAADGIVGYECDGCDMQWRDGLPFPTGEDGTPNSFSILATAPAGLSDADESADRVAEALYGEPKQRSRHPYPGAAVLGSYTGGGTVVTSGCTHWANGLGGNDPQVERITKNVLDRLGRGDRL